MDSCQPKGMASVSQCIHMKFLVLVLTEKSLSWNWSWKIFVDWSSNKIIEKKFIYVSVKAETSSSLFTWNTVIKTEELAVMDHVTCRIRAHFGSDVHAMTRMTIC